jgi:RNA polymerase sigma-70 factor, ECF subfamily
MQSFAPAAMAALAPWSSGPAHTSVTWVDGPDADIRALIGAGNRERALSLLMERHGEGVYHYCCAALEDEDLADDVLQQVFIEVHRDLEKFSGRAPLRSWIFGITRHRVLDQKRVLQRSRGRTAPLKDSTADPQPLPAERLDEARLTEALGACLETLGEHVRHALLLRYQQGFSFEDMAQMCNEKAGTLQARVARALPILRDCIETRTGAVV